MRVNIINFRPVGASISLRAGFDMAIGRLILSSL
jgi:hypothetical protein